MNLRKFLLGFAFVMVVSLFANNSALAVSKFSRAKNTIVAKVEETATSGDKKTTEEIKAVVSEKTEKTSGEEKATKTEEKKEEVKASDEEKATKAEEKKEEVKASGEEKATKAEEKKEEVKASGKEKATKAEEKEEVKASDEKEVTKAEEKKEETVNKKEEKNVDSKAIKDLDEDKWYFDYVVDAVDEKLMKVDEDSKFHAEETVTKQDVADALYKISQRNATTTVKKSTTTTKKEEKEVDTLEWAKKKSVMRESDEGKETLTREQVAKYVYSYAKNIEDQKLTTKERNQETKFEDKEQISVLNKDAVLWCNMNKIIIGRPDNTVGPKDDATRAEAATIFVRLNDYFSATPATK